MNVTDDKTLLAAIRIVLVRTSHPGNTGAAARAMKTMGLSSLWLVRPHEFPHPHATARAAGAADILEQARVVGSLEEALEGCAYAVASTGRHRELAHALLTPREAAHALVGNATGGHEVALVFGHEATGLTNAELRVCPAWTTIPTNPAYGSLNLGSAVQVLAYEIRLAACEPVPPAAQFVAADIADVERLLADLETTLIDIGFLDPASPKRLMERLRRLFARGGIEAQEVNILRGILRAVRRE